MATVVMTAAPSVLAQEKASETQKLKSLTSAFEELQEAKRVSMQVEKKVTSPWLVKPKQAKGTLDFSKGKIRMSLKEPHTSLLVLAGEDIWLEEHQPEEFGGGVQVSHFQVSKAKKSSALLAVLFGESQIWSELELIERKRNKDKVIFKLKPKDKKRLEVKELEITLAGDINQLERIKFSDELDNVTDYQFSSFQFIDDEKPELFRYQPPKGAEITRF